MDFKSEWIPSRASSSFGQGISHFLVGHYNFKGGNPNLLVQMLCPSKATNRYNSCNTALWAESDF
jgi:hypothetical protein